MMWENFDEANHLLYKLYDFASIKNIAEPGKHGKTMAQKKKEIAKRRKRKKNRMI